MTPIAQRLTAPLDGAFVLVLIGMRINRPLRVDRWWPVASAMPRMVRELLQAPQLGLLHAESWFGRTTLMVQYWRTLDQLLAYAHDKQAEHLPAWRDFNRAIGTDGTVGIWHETYLVAPGRHESVYVNMPPFGLARAGEGVPATGERATAARRLHVPPHGESDAP